MNRFKNIRIDHVQRVGVRNEHNFKDDTACIRLETEDEGCTAIVYLTPAQARQLAEYLLKATHP